jgi:hypothetical protein
MLVPLEREEMADQTRDPKEPRFVIPLAPGKVARVPLSVLLEYVDPGCTSAHGHDHDAADVTAHHLAADATTGMTDWHTDYEQGDCDVTDATGMPQRLFAWHRHPFGNEYTEIWEGR